jgi:hypothetical protein
VKHYPLESVKDLRLHNVTAAPAVLQGKKGLRVTVSEEALRQLQRLTPEEQSRAEELAALEGIEFANGSIGSDPARQRQPSRDALVRRVTPDRVISLSRQKSPARRRPEPEKERAASWASPSDCRTT